MQMDSAGLRLILLVFPSGYFITAEVINPVNESVERYSNLSALSKKQANNTISKGSIYLSVHKHPSLFFLAQIET